MMYPFLSQAISLGTLLLLWGLNIFCIPFVIIMYPETADHSLEKLNTVFEHGNSWNVFKSIDRIVEQGIDDWRWTKKLKAYDHAELGQGP